MVTVRVCSKLKTSWYLVVFTNKVGKNSRYFVSFFNKTIIPLALVGYEMIIAILPSHIQRASWNNYSFGGLFCRENWEITYEWQNRNVKNHNCNPFCTFFVMIPFLMLLTASEYLLLSKVNVVLGWRSCIRICSFRLPICSLFKMFRFFTFNWNLTTDCLAFTIFLTDHRRTFVFMASARFSHFSDC